MLRPRINSDRFASISPSTPFSFSSSRLRLSLSPCCSSSTFSRNSLHPIPASHLPSTTLYCSFLLFPWAGLCRPRSKSASSSSSEVSLAASFASVGARGWTRDLSPRWRSSLPPTRLLRGILLFARRADEELVREVKAGPQNQKQ